MNVDLAARDRGEDIPRSAPGNVFTVGPSPRWVPNEVTDGRSGTNVMTASH